MIRTAQQPYNIFIGLGLILSGAIIALFPLPILVRSLGILFCALLAFAHSGTLPAYIIVLLCPIFGLQHMPETWVVMLPIILSTNLLAVMGMDYGWRYGALVIAPLLASAPIMVTWRGSQLSLFNVELPWTSPPRTWLVAYIITIVIGVGLGLLADALRSGAFSGNASSIPKTS